MGVVHQLVARHQRRGVYQQFHLAEGGIDLGNLGLDILKVGDIAVKGGNVVGPGGGCIFGLGPPTVRCSISMSKL